MCMNEKCLPNGIHNSEQRIFYRTMLGVSAMIMQQLTDIDLITYANFSLTIYVKLDILTVDQVLRTIHLHQIRRLL